MIDPRFYNKKIDLTFENIKHITNCQIPGDVDPNTQLDNLATLKDATRKDISFYHNSKYRDALINTQAKMILCSESDVKDIPSRSIALIVDNPYRAYAKLAFEMYGNSEHQVYMDDQQLCHPSAKLGENVVIEPGVIIMANAEIGDNTKIGAYTVIRSGVKIGSNCLIGSHCVISHSIVGNHVTLFPGVKMGQAGFGFVMDKAGHVSVPQLGRVIIEDKVEIGSNTTIDRGTIEDTLIGYGTRIDNLVQVGHGVHIGKHCIIVALVGISGSTEIGNHVIAAGQVGIAGHLKIGDYAVIAAKSGVIRNVDAKETVAGIPAVPIKQWHRQTVMMARMSQPKKETIINE